MTLSGRLPLQRIAALGLLLIVVTFVWMVTVAPLWSAWNRRAEEADRMSELLSHLKLASGDVPSLQQKIARLAQIKRDRSVILVSTSPNLAVATLQAEIKKISEENGGQLRSAQQLPIEPAGSLSKIGVHTDLQADTSQLEGIFYELQVHNPVLLVRNLTIRGSETQTSAQPALLLNVQFDVITLTGQSQ